MHNAKDKPSEEKDLLIDAKNDFSTRTHDLCLVVLCRDTRPVSSRPDFLVPSCDFPIEIESEGNGRDENL